VGVTSPVEARDSSVAPAQLALQFQAFYRDYMHRYRDASSVWFGQNIKGALAEVFERRVTGEPLLVSRNVPYADVYTRFYSQVIHPESAPETPMVIDGDTFDGRAASPRSWLIAAADERWLSSLTTSEWELIALIREPSGQTSFAVYHRLAP
jgi:hypothetical protein